MPLIPDKIAASPVAKRLREDHKNAHGVLHLENSEYKDIRVSKKDLNFQVAAVEAARQKVE